MHNLNDVRQFVKYVTYITSTGVASRYNRSMEVKQKVNISSKQVITAGSILMALWLLGSSIMQPDGFVMSFAAGGAVHGVLRGLIVGALLAVLLSRPPRSMPFRIVLGAVSSVVLAGACVSMMDYQIGILDAILYLQVSIILAIEAIENQTAPVGLSSQPHRT